MTIVAATDTRNARWATDESSFGQRMLAKMGWKGDGLGKNQQGTATHLRAVRRAESLGIGAESDAFGEQGFKETSAGFHGVLANLKREYSSVGESGSEEDAATKKKRRKEEKKRRKKEEKRRARAAKNGGSGGSSDEGGTGVRLAQNKVQAGHARKMREAKDIRNKSAADMAAVFGVKANFYRQPKDWVNGGDSKGGLDDAKAESAGSSSDVADEVKEGARADDADATAAEAKREKKKAKKRKKSKGTRKGKGGGDAEAEVKAKKEKKRRRTSDDGEGGEEKSKKKGRKDQSK